MKIRKKSDKTKRNIQEALINEAFFTQLQNSQQRLFYNTHLFIFFLKIFSVQNFLYVPKKI